MSSKPGTPASCRPVDLLIACLEALAASGQKELFVDREARDCLRELLLQSKAKRKQKVATDAAPRPADVALKAQTLVPPPQARRDSAASGVPAQLAGASAKDKAEALAQLRQKAAALATTGADVRLREALVFEGGNIDARLMLVGEAPGYDEERSGRPFVGKAGQKLEAILAAMGLERKEVYLTNVVKRRPAMAGQTTNNRRPTPAEVALYLPILKAEIAIVAPHVVVALGATAAESLLATAGTVSALRGIWHQCDGIALRVTYHPSYLLQGGSSLATKRALWEDMLAVMEKLELPISAAQRGYFLPKQV